jgi:VWFA-related protein
MALRSLALSLLAVVAGCGGLQLTLKNTAVQKPSNVALYFSVEDRDGAPVAGLEAQAFKIYEDDQQISPFESKQTILNPEVAVVRYTLLLLDLSGSVTESGAVPALISASSAFAENVTKHHKIGVYGFDGGKSLIPLVGFTSSAGSVQSGLNQIASRKAKDPSTNLNGAVVEAIGVLDAQLERSAQPLRFATLVVFTDGTDRAHRVSNEDLDKALAEAKVNIFTIGLGAEISESQLSRIGRNGFVHAEQQGKVSEAFQQVAKRMDDAARKFYLLSYCSPSRAGAHTLRVEVEANGQRGSLMQEFNADGFGTNCDPNRKPSFPIGRITTR